MLSVLQRLRAVNPQNVVLVIVIIMFIGVMVGLLTSCGTIVTAGTVISKRDVAAHLALTSDVPEWVPDKHQVEVRAANGAMGWFTVSPQDYTQIHVGQEWTVPA
jgi:hypothetical protein